MRGYRSGFVFIVLACMIFAAMLFLGCKTSSYESQSSSDVLGYSPPGLESTTLDQTGELCLSGSAVVNTTVGEKTFCVMQGRLGPGVALEIDDLNSVDFADANVFNATTSGNPSNDPQKPFISGATWIDWDDLTLNNVTEESLGSVENNRILDTVANDDYTMLRPQAASCLNDGSVVPKEDFTQSYIANNEEYLYMAQERRTNNGNSVYYWLLTQKPPYVDTNSPDCGSSTRGQILFDIEPGDVEVIVNFPDSSDPTGGAVFFRQYEGSPLTGLLADEAVFNPGWVDNLPAIPNFAMNDVEGDNAGDDGLPHWGGLDKRGNPIPQNANEYAEASFAEWAIDLSVIFGGEPLCGKRLFYTGLSRASTGKTGDPTESSALKDLVGPKLYSFGQITATASVAGNCDLTFDYGVTVVGLDGETPIPPVNLSCSWSCTADTATVTYDANVCSGTGSVDVPDDVTCTVTVNDSDSGCDDSDGSGDDVLQAITVSISPDNTSLSCTVPEFPGVSNGTIGAVNFTPTVTGGDGFYTYSWIVNGPNESSCQTGSATSTCAVDIPDDKYCAFTRVKVWVDDGDTRCPAVASETEEVKKQTSISASDN